MGSPESDGEGRIRDEAFLSQSVVEALVPERELVTLKDQFEGDGGLEAENEASLLPWVQQRDHLFLGTVVPA
jgi:hypothetical protein